MGVQSVKIPVELQIQDLASQIGTLRKALDGVKPDSAAWSKLNGVIEKLESRMSSLARHSKQSFSSTSEIKAFDREFNSLLKDVEKASDSFKNLKFNDLQLDSSAITELENLENKILEMQKNFKKLEKTSIDNFFELDINENARDYLSQAGIKQIPEDYESLIKAIKKKSNELQTAIDNNNKKISDLEKKKQPLVSAIFEGDLEDPDTGKTVQVVESKIKQIFAKYNQAINFEKGKLTETARTDLSIEFSNLGIAKTDYENVLRAEESGFKTAFDNLEKTIQQRVNRINLELNELGTGVNEKDALLKQLLGVGASIAANRDDFETEEVENYKKQIAALEEQLRKLKNSLAQTSSAVQLGGSVANNTAQIYSQYSQQIAKATGQIESMQRVQNALTGAENAVKRWFGFNEVINLTKRIVRDAVTELRELDSVMTEIAVVTDMTQSDLWAQMGTYGAIAEQYGVSTRGVYEVSQLWYQQGLQTAEVMDLTTETLKMAKIANLDYATATDYMTVALRGFKLEMSEAQNVTDVYSALAAATASDTEELAIAMSKTASSAEAVGASFESTSAMIATMISITREAPEIFSGAYKKMV